MTLMPTCLIDCPSPLAENCWEFWPKVPIIWKEKIPLICLEWAPELMSEASQHVVFYLFRSRLTWTVYFLFPIRLRA